ncbi:MAG TPA: energy-coupling factor transporter ATPase [Candidatus Binataceae bacterium]|nr:energy-coupling factor transporter ATPase [Candidatus Binataceae bacterium]
MSATPASFAPAAALERVTFSYRDSASRALCEIDFVLRPGEMVGIMGASGAGKSTLVKCLNRLVPAFEDGDFSGRVTVAGASSDDRPVSDLAATVGMVFQDFEAQLFSTNAGLEVAFGLQQAGLPREEIIARIGPALEAVGLGGFESRDPTTLSGGEKQRLAIAAVLAMRPRIIVFDEPTTDLDPEGRAEVLELIQSLRGQGLSLILIDHDAEALRACDRVLLMRDGAIIAEACPEQIMPRVADLESAGVRPPDLNRAWATLGLEPHPRDLATAERYLRERLGERLAATDNAARDARPIAPDRNLLTVSALRFAYSTAAPAIEDVNLTIAAGEFVAIVGRNGSGKTTLAKLIAGLLTPAAGVIRLDGRDRHELSALEAAQAVGYVFQNPDHQIFAATVEDEVAFGPQNFKLAPDEVSRRVAEVLAAVDLTALRSRDPFLLSKGERQRLAVAGILALRPRLLILDEPTTGLDYREQRRMMTLIEELNRSGIAIVIITHTPWLIADYARRVVLMRRGRIRFDGSVSEFFADEDLLKLASFRPPEINLLARRLGLDALNVQQFVTAIRALRSRDPAA